MSKQHKLALFIFRRDLRLQDNTALIAALNHAETVIPCFIFDKRQITHNDYCGEHLLAFMAKSLHELDSALQNKNSRLYCFSGIAEQVIGKLLQTLPIDAVYLNEDYTPFSRERDQHTATVCKKVNVSFHIFADALLHSPNDIHKNDGTPYSVFTPFYKKALPLPVKSPHKNAFNNYYQKPIQACDTKTLSRLLQKQHGQLLVKGGRKEALTLLKRATTLTEYNNTRDQPALAGTTKLSAHHKFGTVSIREVFYALEDALGRHCTLISELYWRDFFTHITYHYPRVIGQAFKQKYMAISWSKSEKNFRAWCEGQTGFPIVDAGMRELNTTGYMHNRVRMIVASFLTKDLHIDWRRGEKYFAQQLLDYDPAVNNGNWQWAASTGCDAQPYFRIFNPWLQQLKFDPDCTYIKQWIPELANTPAKVIHNLYKGTQDMLLQYPKPIVDHAKESARAKEIYKSC